MTDLSSDRFETWIDRRFRSSPALELKRIEELPVDRQAPFIELRHDEDFYGLLVPRVPRSGTLDGQPAGDPTHPRCDVVLPTADCQLPTGRAVPRNDTVKAVGRQTARLFSRLATAPSTLDASLLADDAWREDIIDLVLDGIFEIESDGRFVYGAEAFPLMLSEAAGGARASLSCDALRHAEALATRDTGLMTAALYSYNRLPRTRTWTARFPNREAVLAHLGENALLDRHWIRSQGGSGWISWQTRSPRRANARR